MKRLLCVVLALAAALSLAACGDAATARTGTAAPNVNDLLNTPSDLSLPASSQAAATGWRDTGATQYQTVDVDLTAMSSTMVYSEVYAMMTEPDKYRGKTVRMKGNFSVFEDAGNYYYACLVADATACCSQGIEFVTSRQRAYPTDYPDLGTEITVTGVFGTYDEGEYTYCQLADAELR